MMEFTGAAKAPAVPAEDANKAWIDAILKGEQSPGSFQKQHACSETAVLAAVALRAGKKIIYDPEALKITNIPEANKYLYRTEYRKGWEI
jgi:ABC-type xylose transport system substrate-binding protein